MARDETEERKRGGLGGMGLVLFLLLAEMEQYAESAERLARAAAGMPVHSRVLYNLALVEQRLGRLDRAMAAIERALALEPQNADYRNAAGWLASQ